MHTRVIGTVGRTMALSAPIGRSDESKPAVPSLFAQTSGPRAENMTTATGYTMGQTLPSVLARGPIGWRRRRPHLRAAHYGLVSANVMFPFPVWTPGGLGDAAPNERADRLSRKLTRSRPDAVAVQECFPQLIAAMEARGYKALDAQFSWQNGVPAAQREARQRAGTGWVVRVLSDLQNWKRRYTGLAVFVRNERFAVSKSSFLRYSNAAQAGLRTSASGLLRTDGVQVVHLRDIQHGNDLLLVNTHHESYDPAVRARQRQEWREELDRLRRNYPDAVLQVVGDFNDSQELVNLALNGLKPLSANPLHHITFPQNSTCIDGQYTLVPSGCRATVFGAVVDAGADSDHNFIDAVVHVSPSISKSEVAPPTGPAAPWPLRRTASDPVLARPA